MEHMVGLYVRTEGEEDFKDTFGMFASMALDLAENHDYVNLSSQKLDPDPDSDGYTYDEVRYNDQTLVKVRVAMSKALFANIEMLTPDKGNTIITDMISELQNAGIVLRERTPSR